MKRLDFRDGSKDKIRCGSGGVKTGLMEDDVTGITRSPEDDVTPGYDIHTIVSRRFPVERMED